MKDYIQAQLDMGCEGILAMPNTKPPVGKVFSADPLPYWSVEEYHRMILDAGGDRFSTVIVPLYLTKDTTPQMIEEGAKAGLLGACKYYPPHGTTNSDHGRPLADFLENGIIRALEDNGVILCLHGEEHGLKGEAYFGRNGNAEDYFYRERMPRLREKFPKLKIVGEHITTRTAVDFIRSAGDLTGATITPQHLMHTIADLVQGLRYHLYCLPLVKFEEDRQALLAAVNDPQNRRIFAGTDSAPHTTKATDCGCAAGCFTGGIAPQLYADSFEFDRGQDNFERFLCLNGADFYGLPVPAQTFTLTSGPQPVHSLSTEDGEIIPLPLGLGKKTIDWKLEIA